jgi:hypothetical protein
MWGLGGNICAYLTANNIADELLACTNSLVPRTLLAVWIISRNTAGGGSEAWALGRGVAQVVLDISLVLLGDALVLVAGGAGEVAEGLLDGAGGRVDVGLDGRGVIVCHFEDCVKCLDDLKLML